MQTGNPITIKQWKIIRFALSYAYSNWDDLQEAFGEELGVCSEQVADILERAKIESNEARKLALCYFELYPKEATFNSLTDNPKLNLEEVWESIDCTYQNWLNRLYDNPAKALATTNWCGKVTKAYFKMIGVPCPTLKKKMVVALRGQQ